MKHDKAFIKHVLEETNYLLDKTKGLEFKDFMADETLKRAAARSLEIIGEASKNLSPEFKNRHKNIEWKKISGLRDKIIHGYFGINWDILWDVIKNKVPSLKEEMQKEDKP
jgi:uncharacterized protein with HEPN domain